MNFGLRLFLTLSIGILFSCSKDENSPIITSWEICQTFDKEPCDSINIRSFVIFSDAKRNNYPHSEVGVKYENKINVYTWGLPLNEWSNYYTLEDSENTFELCVELPNTDSVAVQYIRTPVDTCVPYMWIYFRGNLVRTSYPGK